MRYGIITMKLLSCTKTNNKNYPHPALVFKNWSSRPKATLNLVELSGSKRRRNWPGLELYSSPYIDPDRLLEEI